MNLHDGPSLEEKISLRKIKSVFFSLWKKYLQPLYIHFQIENLSKTDFFIILIPHTLWKKPCWNISVVQIIYCVGLIPLSLISPHCDKAWVPVIRSVGPHVQTLVCLHHCAFHILLFGPHQNKHSPANIL